MKYILFSWCFFFIPLYNSLFAQKILATQEFDSLLITENKKLQKTKSREEMIAWNTKLMAQAKKQNYHKGEIWALANLSNYYWRSGNFKKSIEKLSIAEKLIKEYGADDFTIAKIYQEYSQTYYPLNLYELALKNNAKAIFYGLKINDPLTKRKFLTYIYSTRSSLLYVTHQKDSALIYLQKSKKLYPTPFNTSNIAGHYIEYERNLDSAKIYLDKALLLLNEKTTSYDVSVIYYYYGYYYNEKKQYTDALKSLKKSMTINKINNPLHNSNIYRQLSIAYEKLDSTEQQKTYLEKYTFLKDSIERAQVKGVDESIKKLEEEKKEESNNSIQKLWIYTGIGLCICLFIFIYLYCADQKKKKLIAEKKEIIEQKEIETRVLKKKVNDAFDEIVQLAKENNTEFLTRFREVYPDLYEKLIKINPNLTKSELEFSAMIWLGFSSKEIADYRFMQHRSVQTKKNRLRKKLNIPSDTDIYFFLKSLE